MRTFGCEFFCSYGMTECCGKISMSLLTPEVRALPQSTQLDLVCTSGYPFIFTDLRVVNEAGKDVARDGVEVGEVRWLALSITHSRRRSRLHFKFSYQLPVQLPLS